MRWDVVVGAWLTLIAADSDVTGVLGRPPELWMAGERDQKAPSMEWQLVADTENENYEVTLVQLDLLTRSDHALVKLERALRRLLHHDTPIVVDGHELWSQLVGGSPLQGPKDGIHRRSLDFRLTYLRGKYA